MDITIFRHYALIGILSSVVCLLAGLSDSWAVELAKPEDALRTIYPSLTDIERNEILLSDEQMRFVQEAAGVSFGKTHFSKFVVYRIFESKRTVGYAFEDVVIGKWGPIRYLVGLDADGTVLQVIVLEYKEIRGRPVAKKRFLNQYKGKTIQDELMLRVDIDGVTGATISSRSLTDGVRKVLHIYPVISDSFPSGA